MSSHVQLHVCIAHMYMYCILSSERPSPCISAHPPLFDDPMVHVYVRYTYKWLVCVSAHPVFWLVNCKRPWALTRENMVCAYVHVVHVSMMLSPPLPPPLHPLPFHSRLPKLGSSRRSDNVPSTSQPEEPTAKSAAAPATIKEQASVSH